MQGAGACLTALTTGLWAPAHDSATHVWKGAESYEGWSWQRREVRSQGQAKPGSGIFVLDTLQSFIDIIIWCSLSEH